MTSYPLPECRIEPRCNYNVFTRPSTSRPFLPLWFTIPDEIADDLLVTDVRVGRRSQLISTGCVPAGLFAESAARDADGQLVDVLQLPVVETNQFVSLSLTNATDRPVSFRGSVVGCDPEHAPDRPRSLLMGCGYYENGPSAPGRYDRSIDSHNVRIVPQVRLRPHKLYVPASVLEGVVIRAVTTEVDPGETLSKVASESVDRISIHSRENIVFEPDPTVPPGRFVRIEMINQTGEPRWFGAAILGWLAQDQSRDNSRTENELR
jgi:hypothetical protein